MALDRFGAETLLSLKQAGADFDAILTLGRQQLALSPLEARAFDEFSEVLLPSTENEDGDYSDRFLRELGFRSIVSLDASPYENCTWVHDLNLPIPENWQRQHDVVFDGGTLEHVFHFPNAITNAMNLVKPGGFLVIQSPSNHLNGHGFYQFSPELIFRVLDSAYGFQLRGLALVESEPRVQRYRVTDPAALEQRVTFGGSGPLQIIAVASRISGDPVSLSPAPAQSDYSASWEASETTLGSPASPARRHPLRRFLPTRWLESYDRGQSRKARRHHSQAGIQLAGSLAECFFPGETP